jgi:hypothetical protein
MAPTQDDAMSGKGVTLRPRGPFAAKLMRGQVR